MTAKLLLADDSPTIQRVIELTFSGEDIDVITVNDGDQAILRIPLERPDIVLADIGMPKRSGYEVAAFVKDHPELSHVPVLLLAGAFEPVDEARARQVQSAGVLVKPFEPQQVVARVRELVRAARTPQPKEGPRSAHAPWTVTPQPPMDRAAQEVPAVGRQMAPTEPALPQLEIGGADAGNAPTSLDDYFDRLDAAFATLGTSKTPPPRSPSALAGDAGYVADVPTLDEVLGAAAHDGGTPEVLTSGAHRIPAPEAAATHTPSVAPARGGGSAEAPNALADLFHLLLAVEQGQIDPANLSVGAGARGSEISDELIERVARRVLERLAPDAVREIVADLVSPIAERLVREEIDRIRRG